MKKKKSQHHLNYKKNFSTCQVKEVLRFKHIFVCFFREKNSVLSSQRRLERKLKDLNITLDEERHQHTEQRDQVKNTHDTCAHVEQCV